ncbi:hypothetical protein MH117_20845 [Paenibacillus sp. ACRRX]|uniref:hypothetical protein n=1 Tax=Paenibacillus sp. ACRRX TaxID=2918206 RepID=UPI001EF4A328|nr:hypothetical protein [Paenibacillus sp. ACRRX]MCG7409860.1 hypothetical protein [Paenibacillus sp. ACRRX]
MSADVICPWCDTEIVWDEVLGPEEECPYCHNELQEYRTLSVPLEAEEDEEEGIESMQVKGTKKGGKGHANAAQSAQGSDDTIGWGDDSMLLSSPNQLQFEEGVGRVLHDQLEVPECPHCREYMLLAGQETVAASAFQPNRPAALDKPLLQAPFTLDVYVCASCFHVSKSLSMGERESLITQVNRLSENDN